MFEAAETLQHAAWLAVAGGLGLLALGCIQARACNTNRCPTGVTTQDKALARAIDVEEKAKRVYRFQRATVEAFLELCGAMGLQSPDELGPAHLYIRRDDGVHTYADVNCSLLPGQLLVEGEGPERFRRDWDSAGPDSF